MIPLPGAAVQENVMITMRDGVALACDIYGAEGDDSPRPVILLRSPYSKSALPLFTPQVLQKGYVVCYQDIRGRFESDGEFELFDPININDAVDTIAWLREQPFCNGKVGMSGSSYLAIMQYFAAVGTPEGLDAILPLQGAMPALDFGAGMPSMEMVPIFAILALGDYSARNQLEIEEDDLRDAVARSLENFTQLNPQILANLFAPEPDMAAVGELQQRVFANTQAIQAYCLSGSLKSKVATIAQYAPWVQHFIDAAAGNSDSKLTACNYRDQLDQSKTPHLGVCGWYEPFVGEVLEDFAAAQQRKNGPLHRLIVPPVAHYANPGMPVGEREIPTTFPEELTLLPAQAYPTEFGNLSQRWLDHCLKGEDNGVADEPLLSLFVMGAERWRHASQWPLPETRWTTMFLGSGGSANTAGGDGTLAFESKAAAESDTYVYDPENPVPTLGSYWLGLSAIPSGPFKQGPLSDRADILFYTSDPLTRETEVTGPITLKLWVSTSAADTDFIVKLVDVEPGGDAWMVTMGQYRMRANGAVKPGEISMIELPVTPTGYAFRAGHRIRLQLTSSDFPAIDRNPNTGSSLLVSDEMVAATQYIFHSDEYPSQLILPVIPE